MRFRRPGFCGLLIALALAAPWPRAAPVTAEEAGAAPFVTVTMQRNRFWPDFDVVSVGATVEWRNDEANPRNRHDVYTEDGTFASPVILPGEVWSFTFMQEGYYSYFCSYHDGMEGALLVVPVE